jgi:ABC-2 type transport system ATP-binding protein
VLARASGLPDSRADETLELAGLGGAENRRVGGYSLGMRQRLAIAAALLGDPDVLVLDEPANGLDPQGIHWLRELLRHQAGQGRAVLVSSHVLAEVAQTADDVVVIDRGLVVAQGPIDELSARAGGAVEVRSPDAGRLADALRARGLEVRSEGSGRLIVSGATAAEVGKLALENAVILHHLAERGASLEELFLQLTGEEA